MVAAVEQHKRVLQVGSNRRSHIVYAKAREIYASGFLGQVTAIEASIELNDASGAGVYPIPPDASERTIDWERFLGSAPKRPFDAKRFFRWRGYEDYGEGIPGDVYVHLFTGIYTIIGDHTPPRRAAAMGGLFRWKEERELPDFVWTLYEYPEFRACLRVNLNYASPDTTRICGTEGTLLIQSNVLTVTPQETRPKPESYSIWGWPEKLRKQYLAEWRAEQPEPAPGSSALVEQARTFRPPPGYDDTVDHLHNFLEAVRTRKPPNEDEVFGNHTAIACHMANYSYSQQAVAVWNAAARRIEG